MTDKQFSTGIFMGLGSGLAWAINGVLFGIIYALNLSTEILIFPLIIGMLNEVLSAIILLSYHSSARLSLISTLKTKHGRLLLLSGVIAGPIGMSSYYMSIKYIGASSALLLTSMFPIFSLLYVKFKHGEKTNRLMVYATLSVIVGLVVLGFNYSGIQQRTLYIFGFILAIIAMTALVIEGSIASYTKCTIKQTTAVSIRYMSSALAYLIILFTIFFDSTITVLSDLTIKSIILIICIACTATISRSLWYQAIRSIGIIVANTLNITYGFWAVIITIVLASNDDLLILLSGTLLILIGAICVTKGKLRLHQ